MSGIVQGVGYRYFARQAATRLGLCGYAKNLRDGRVEVYAIGRAEDLAALVRQLERGPQGASVNGVTVEEAVIDGRFSEEFSIEHDR